MLVQRSRALFQAPLKSLIPCAKAHSQTLVLPKYLKHKITENQQYKVDEECFFKGRKITKLAFQKDIENADYLASYVFSKRATNDGKLLKDPSLEFINDSHYKYGPLLVQAASKSQDKLALNLLLNGADVHLKDSFNRTALSYCFRNRNSHMAYQLLLHGAKIEEKVPEEMLKELLAFSILEKKEGVLRILIKESEKISFDPLFEETLLSDAIKSGSIDMTHQLLKSGIILQDHQIVDIEFLKEVILKDLKSGGSIAAHLSYAFLIRGGELNQLWSDDPELKDKLITCALDGLSIAYNIEKKQKHIELAHTILKEEGKYIRADISLDLLIDVTKEAIEAIDISDNAEEASNNEKIAVDFALICLSRGASLQDFWKGQEYLKDEVIRLAPDYLEGALERKGEFSNGFVLKLTKELKPLFKGEIEDLITIAIEQNCDISVLKELMSFQEVDYIYINESGMNIVGVAINADYTEALKFLMQQGPDDLIDTPADEADNSPIEFALSIEASADILEVLVQYNPSYIEDLDPDSSELKDLLQTFIKGEKTELALRVLEKSHSLINEAAIFAAFDGNLEFLKQLIASYPSCDINYVNAEGESPLICAAYQGHVNIANFLASIEDLKINAQIKKTGKTALHIASERGDAKMVRALLKRGDIAVNQLDYKGRSPIIRCSKLQHNDCLKALVGHKDININIVKPKHGDTPLMYAIGTGNIAGVKILLNSNKIDVNKPNTNGKMFPLELAVDEKNQDIIELLLQRKDLNVNASNGYNSSALNEAVFNNDLSTVKLLLKRKDLDVNVKDKEGMTPLMRSARRGYNDVLEQLIKRDDIDVNIGSSEGNATALYSAIVFDNHIAAKMLLNHPHIDINKSCGNRNTPLLECVFRKNYEVMKLLLVRDELKVNYSNQNNETPLIHAAFIGDETSLKLLLAHEKIDLKHVSKMGHSAIIYAVGEGHMEAVKLLIEKDASLLLDRSLNHNKSTLMVAAGRGHLEMFKFLLAKLPDEEINYKDLRGQDILEYASYSQNDKLVKFILDQDQLDKERDSFQSAFDIAVELGNLRMIEYFLGTNKVAKDTFRNSITRNRGIGAQFLRDILFLTSKVPSGMDLKALKADQLNTIIPLIKDKPLALNYLYSKNKVALVLSAKLVPIEFIRSLRSSIVDLEGPKDSHTFPAARLGVKVESLGTIAQKIGIDGEELQFIKTLCQNVQKRMSLIGLPNQISQPHAFKKAYDQIEKVLKVITQAVEEIDTKYQSEQDPELKKDLREKLGSIFSHLSEIGAACGTRYIQDLPILYHSQILMIEGIECIETWKAKPIIIPSHLDPVLSIQKHLGKALYASRLNVLHSIFLTHSHADVHELSAFWQLVKRDFHLDMDDLDPYALRNFPLEVSQIKSIFNSAMKAEDVLKETMEHISIGGGDTNPYISFLSFFLNQEGVKDIASILDAFECDEEGTPTHIKKEYVALILFEAGILRG